MEYSKEILGFMAIAIGLIGNIPYIIGIYKGEVRPHLFSWIIWTLVCGIGAAIQINEGGGAGAWYMVYNTILNLGITIASCYRGTKDIRRSDWVAFMIALSAIPLWAVTQQPLWSGHCCYH